MSTADASPALPRSDSSDRVLRIQRSSHWASLDLRELWTYRELLFFLTWRDVKSSYNQTALGILWAILKPFISMVVFSVIFGRLAGIKGEYGVPYPLWVFAGLLPWTYFAVLSRPKQREHRGQREPRHEGLLPAAHHPDRVDRQPADRLHVRLRHLHRDVRLLRPRAALAR